MDEIMKEARLICGCADCKHPRACRMATAVFREIAAVRRTEAREAAMEKMANRVEAAFAKMNAEAKSGLHSV